MDIDTLKSIDKIFSED